MIISTNLGSHRITYTIKYIDLDQPIHLSERTGPITRH